MRLREGVPVPVTEKNLSGKGQNVRAASVLTIACGNHWVLTREATKWWVWKLTFWHSCRIWPRWWVGLSILLLLCHLETGESTRADKAQRLLQLFDPEPAKDRRNHQNKGVGRYRLKNQVPSGNCCRCGQPVYFAKECLQKTVDHLK